MRANPLQEMLRDALCDAADEGLALLAEVRRTPGPSTAAAWSALLADASLGSAFIEAITRSGALQGRLDPRRRLLVEDLITALGRLPHDAARDLLVRLWTGPAVDGELRIAAGDALLSLGDEASHRALTASLDRESGAALTLALRGLFALGPTAAYDRIAPQVAQPGDRSASLLQAVLRLLMNDVLESRKPGAKAPSLFARDPRWKQLCETWLTAPSPEVVSRWGGPAAHTIHEIAAWLHES